jgi:transcriptional regulator GlxA family with amidase domain
MEPTNIIFLILPNVHLLDLAGPDQVFHEAIDYGANIEIHYCSFEHHLQTSARLPFGTVKNYTDIPVKAGDYVIVPGADIHYLTSKQFIAQKPLFHWVREAHTKGAIICSVCTGSFFLGEAGLLEGRECTTHWKRVHELQTRYLSAKVQENVLFTEDDGVMTSAGVASGIDLALHILSKLTDDYFAFQVAREIVVYSRRQGHHAQQSVFLSYRNHIHSGVHKVQDWLHYQRIHDTFTQRAYSKTAQKSQHLESTNRSRMRLAERTTGFEDYCERDYLALNLKEKKDTSKVAPILTPNFIRHIVSIPPKSRLCPFLAQTCTMGNISLVLPEVKQHTIFIENRYARLHQRYRLILLPYQVLQRLATEPRRT